MTSLRGIPLTNYALQLADTASKNVLNSAVMLDAVGKLRTSQPENMIDTDFEYGLQTGKWETIELINNIPTFFSRDGDSTIPVSDVQVLKDSYNVTTTTVSSHGLIVGSPILLVGLREATAEGINVIMSVPSSNQFIYKAKSRQTISGSIFDPFSTQLYVARIFQGAQYNLDNIVSMDTDGGNEENQESIVTVVTETPHGFEQNSSFILTNSVGQKEVPFDASTIDAAETINIQKTVIANSETGLAGFSSRAVNPYDYQSKKTIFFASSNVSLANNSINVTGHGLLTGMQVMYVSPIGDTPVGGLSSYSLYDVTRVDEDSIRLNHIEKSIMMGGIRFGYSGQYTYDPVVLSGLTASLLEIRQADFNLGVTSGTTTAYVNYTLVHLTYFCPPTTGVYYIRCTSNSSNTNTSMAFRVWFGNSALNSTNTNASIQQANTTVATTSLYATPTLQAGLVYPMRLILCVRARGDGTNKFSRTATLQWNNTPSATNIVNIPTGNATVGNFQVVNQGVEISAINTTTNVLTVTRNHGLETGRQVKYIQGTAAIGGLVNNTLYYVRVVTITTLKLYTTEANANADTNSVTLTTTAAGAALLVPQDIIAPITFTSTGTDSYGYHVLLKAYQILSAPSRTQLDVAMNLSNYLDASLASADRLVLFGGCTRASIFYGMTSSTTTGTTPNTTIDATFKAFGVNNTSHTFDNFSQSLISYYFIKGSPNVGSSSTVVQIIPNATQTTTATSWSGPTTLTQQHCQLMFNGVSWLVPAQVLTDMNSIYIPSHGFITSDVVTLSSVSGALPTGLATTTYSVSVLTPDQVQLLVGTQVVDVQSVGSGEFRLSLTKANPTAGTIYAPEHGFYQLTTVIYSTKGNTAISGLTEGGTYYIINTTENSFKLSSTANGSSRVVFGGTGSNIHSFTSTERATDGTFKIKDAIDPRTFSLYYPFLIPTRVITVHPRKSVNLNKNNLLLTSHKMRTGAKVVYSAGGDTDIGGLTSDQTYYIIRIDTDHVRLALSAEDAMNNIPITLADNGSGSAHTFSLSSVCGELITSLNVSLTQGTYNVYAPSEDILATSRVGDTLRVEIINPLQITLTVSTIDATNDVITFSAAHGLVDGQDIRFTQGTATIGGLDNGFIYYARTTGLTTPTTQVQLFATKTDATSGTNRVDITTTTVGGATFIRIYQNTIYSAKIVDIRDSFNVTVDTAAPSTITNGRYIRTTSLYPRTDGFALHRPYDGGVEMIPSGNPYSQLIRQTRKYFRYQSGKGIQISSAVNFSGPVQLLKLTRSDTTATGLTRRPHRMTPGVTITISGVVESATGNFWNGTYIVTDTPTDTTFTIELENVPDEVTAAGMPTFVVEGWTNAIIRTGLFDLQNGMGFAYDGNSLYVFRRNSMTQLPGTCTVEFNSSQIIGDTNTRFLSTASVGDNIVIKGQTYRVVAIENNNLMYVQPAYRGISVSEVIVSVTKDELVPQSQWNVDTLDGTGPSGYNLDIHKIQMTYIDYSWYGAGAIRFGFRTTNGEIKYCHTITHNNEMTESYMRSGNIPAHYEVSTTGVPSYIPSLMHWGTSVIMDGRFDDDKAYWFTASGKLMFFTGPETDIFIGDNNTHTTVASSTVIANGTNQQAYRLVANSYNKVQYLPPGTVVTGATAGVQAGTVTVGYPVKRGSTSTDTAGYIYLNKPRVGGTLSTSANYVIGVSNDYIPYGKIPLVSIRLSPSADNNRPGVLGSREIINRMQLQLKKLGILTTHDVEVTLLLNAYPYTKTWQSVTSPSLSQVLLHEKGDVVNGGTEIFSFRVNGGNVDSSFRHFSTTTNIDLDSITDLGNSILGGDGTYPNGPDILTITGRLLDYSGITPASPFVISARISWTESQA